MQAVLYMKQLLCRLVSEVQGVVEEAGGNLKHLSAMEEVAYFDLMQKKLKL